GRSRRRRSRSAVRFEDDGHAAQAVADVAGQHRAARRAGAALGADPADLLRVRDPLGGVDRAHRLVDRTLMRAPPSPAKLLQYPASGGAALLAIAISIMSLLRSDVIDKLAIDDRAFWAEPWRLLTSTLPHLGVLHLVFNVYWTWVFGSALEERYGHFRLFLAMLLFAAVPLAAEWAFLHGGCGLSGVGYGLFGWAWMIARRDPRFRDV